MKLVLFNDFVPGVLKGDRVVDVSDAVADIPRVNGQTLMSGLIERFDQYRAPWRGPLTPLTGVPMDQVRLRAPLPEPTRMVCLAGNYMEGASRALPSDREAFLKSPSAVIGNGDTVELPDCPAAHFHHEAELGVVIGKTASKVKAEDASDYHLRIREFHRCLRPGHQPKRRPQFFLGEILGHLRPMGPALVTADEVPDPQNLSMKLWVSGDLGKTFIPVTWARSVKEVVEFVTWILTMQPGDVISTGTNHLGLAPIQDGDSIEMEIEGLGRLSLNVHDDWKRTWPREPLSKMTAFESTIRSKVQAS